MLSYTGGAALDGCATDSARAGWRRSTAMSIPDVHRPCRPVAAIRVPTSPISAPTPLTGRAALEASSSSPPGAARAALPDRRARNIPQDFPWTDNIYFVRHLPPAEHPAFFSSSPADAQRHARTPWPRWAGVPSGRLFEAAACGAAILSDWWEGLDAFFEPGREILVARTTEDALAALDLSDARLAAHRGGAPRARPWRSTHRRDARANSSACSRAPRSDGAAAAA